MFVIQSNSPMPSTNDCDEFLQTPEFKAIALQAQNRRLAILIAGRAGVGKSSTVNRLLGRTVAPVVGHEPTASLVEHYLGDLEGLPVDIAVSPGLCEDEGHDDEIAMAMQNSIKEIHSLWY